MAIKFSQFVVKTSSSDLSHIVGYNGADNIQITPTNFLNTALTGTAGQVLFYDTTGVAGDNDLYWDNTNKRLGIGTITPSASLHVNPSSGGNGEVNVERTSGTIINLQAQSALGVIGTNSNHDLAFKTNGNAYVRLKTNGNVGIGTASPSEKLEVVGNIKVGDSQKFIAGDSGDLQIYHNGSDSYIDNITNHLVIQNQSANKDIIFKSDDGSGGLATYFQLDGGDELTLFSKNVKLSDSVELRLGNSNDLVIKHNATNSVVDNTTGNLVIQNQANDADIIFKSDDGSGGTAEYFRLDGSAAITVASKEFRFADSVPLKFGNLPDVEIIHNGTNTLISNETGDLYITNAQNDGDILFRCDDGSGGIAEYFRVDGGLEEVIFSKSTRHMDNVQAKFGSGEDLQIYHNGTNSLIDNNVGDISIRQLANDKDIRFRCDDGSGGEAEYFRVDGGNEHVVYSKPTIFSDNIALKFGDGIDLQIESDGSNGKITNNIGDLYIINSANDETIFFQNDDGSGGVTTYFEVQGSNIRTVFRKTLNLQDSVNLYLGTGSDLRFVHNGSDSIISNTTGNLTISNSAADKDIIFEADNGSGSTTEYFRVDGGDERVNFSKNAGFSDNVKAMFGDGLDLRIYHDGSNSYIDETGTGNLYIRSGNFYLQTDSNENAIVGLSSAQVELYHNGNKKLETTSTGIKVTSVSEYADNAAAIAAGLTTGDVYRTGDLLKIVH